MLFFVLGCISWWHPN